MTALTNDPKKHDRTRPRPASGSGKRIRAQTPSRNDPHAPIRSRLAHEAARLISVGEAADYPQARRKAAKRLGVAARSLHPANEDIDVAVREYQRLFRPDTTERSQRYRKAALEAMEFFASFRPMLTGPVLDGTVDAHSVVTIHLHTDDTDSIVHHLAQHGITADTGVIRLRRDPHRDGEFPVWRFFADDVPFELIGLPLLLARQAPLAPGEDRSMRRASTNHLRRLTEVEQ